MRRIRKILRRCAIVVVTLVVIMMTTFLIYFPGRQSLIALTLASGVGVAGLQNQVDALEEKAIRGESFTDEDKDFLCDLYTCFVKGANLTVTLRQSAQLMSHYLSKSGDDLRLEPRIFIGSAMVQEQIAELESQIVSDLHTHNTLNEEYVSGIFYMGDPNFFESYVGLYFGRLHVQTNLLDDGTVLLQWRAEMPWQWPSYDSLYAKYGDYHAQSFPLPNARSFLQGQQYCLRMDDGLGEHLAQIGLAKPFLAYSEWEGQIENSAATQNRPQP